MKESKLCTLRIFCSIKIFNVPLTVQNKITEAKTAFDCKKVERRFCIFKNAEFFSMFKIIVLSKNSCKPSCFEVHYSTQETLELLWPRRKYVIWENMSYGKNVSYGKNTPSGKNAPIWQNCKSFPENPVLQKESN